MGKAGMTMVDSKKIGQLILTRRKAMGCTQQQLAELLGVTNKAVSKWETGEGLPDISLFPVLAEVLGVPVDRLLQGSDIEEEPTNQREQTLAADGVVLPRYQWERQIEKFKKRGLLAWLISVLGIICFCTIWLEEQDYYSFGVGMIFQALSVCLFISAYWSLRFEERAYLRLHSGEAGNVNSKPLMIKFLCFLFAFWLVIPLLFLDIFAMRLIPWAHSSLFDMVPFLICFGVIVLFLLYRFRKS